MSANIRWSQQYAVDIQHFLICRFHNVQTLHDDPDHQPEALDQESSLADGFAFQWGLSMGEISQPSTGSISLCFTTSAFEPRVYVALYKLWLRWKFQPSLHHRQLSWSTEALDIAIDWSWDRCRLHKIRVGRPVDESGPKGFGRGISENPSQSRGGADLRRGSAETEGAMPKSKGRCRKDQSSLFETKTASRIRGHGQSTPYTPVGVACSSQKSDWVEILTGSICCRLCCYHSMGNQSYGGKFNSSLNSYRQVWALCYIHRCHP